jgi:hypothetical protein
MRSQGPRIVTLAPAQDVLQRTRSGWLQKRGGKLGNKGWDRRWFVLENGQLQCVCVRRE